VVHAVIHKRGRWLPGLAAHHKLHHRDPTVNFGVTTTLLDHLMGTIRVEKGE
jgi:sterol desaturase/sphingolipid hydroxylase (fatty acid hydroxylase superfamily)